jgi:CBS domain-containing protein
MRVADISTRQIVSLRLQASTDEAVRVMLLHGYREYPVLADGRVVGYVSDEELLAPDVSSAHAGEVHAYVNGDSARNGVARNGRANGRRVNGARYAHRLVQEVMCRPPVPIGPDEPCGLAAWRMVETGAHALYVTVDTVLQGIVTSTNLLRAYTGFVRDLGGASAEPLVGAFATRLDAFPGPRDCARDTLGRLRELGVRSLPVVAGGRVVGSVSRRGLLELLRAAGPDGAPATGDAMDAALAAVAVDASLVEAAERLLASKQSALPVADRRGRLAGVVTPQAVVRHCATANLTYGGFPA